MSEIGGRLVIISGPSGAGKSTVVRRLLAECPLPLTLSVSATTRHPRPDEQGGREYHFLDAATFEQRRQAGEFLECKEVFGRGVWYGTLRSEVARGLAQGRWMILEIDVEGAASVLKQDLNPITLFLHSGDLDKLETRLRNRGTESEEAIQRRLEVARQEMRAIPRYEHEVINDTVERAVAEICQILESHQADTVGRPSPAALPASRPTQ